MPNAADPAQRPADSAGLSAVAPSEPSPNLKHTLFARLLADPVLTWAVVGSTFAIVALHLAGIAAWHCPFKQVTGLPCPGCGMTRSCGALLHGDVKASLTQHAFGPLFLAGGAALIIAACLPPRFRASIVRWLAPLERRTRCNAILLAAILIYTLTRWFCLT